MMKRLFTLSILGLAVSAAHATSFPLTVSKISGFGTGSYGTVTLTQSGSNVIVSETLTAGEVFAKTGAGNALQFNLSTGTIDAATLASEFTVGTPKSLGGVGSFGYAISCSGCGNGTSSPDYSGPLTFTVDNATIASFTATNGYYFSADIGIPNGDDGQFATGNVLSDTSVTSPTPTPEPSSLMLMGTGVLGAAGLVRRRFTK